jgi:hypothetical protein
MCLPISFNSEICLNQMNILLSIILKNHIFLDIVPCNSLKVSLHCTTRYYIPEDRNLLKADFQ